ncbi:TlpA family protein disulfide reductase [Candidatus Amoebophilus asiaticus]|nr:TlpA family protein disulfide reductase [Candidatus Amoebophilus asiaticus]
MQIHIKVVLHFLISFLIAALPLNTLLAQEPAPDFTYKDINGKEVSLSDFKGKVVYLEVWASWCQFCRKELPHSKRLERLFRKDNVVFLHVSIEQNEERWKEFIQEKKIKGVHLITKQVFESDVVKQYGIVGIPHFILIDKDGNLVTKKAKRPSTYGIEDELARLLDEQ